MFKSKFTVYRPDRKTKKYQLVGITLSTNDNKKSLQT